MSGKLQAEATQGEPFAFTPQHMQQAKTVIARYPQGRQQSAVMPLLMLAQQQHDGWLPKAAMDAVADMLGMPKVRVYEIATFYSMYNLEPVGRHVINVCTTTPCWLRGSEAIVRACEQRLGIGIGGTTADGTFTVREVECLGACVNAPMCQVIDSKGEYFYEDLTPEKMVGMLDALAQGRELTPGPQSGRKSSEPVG